ncbi:hypothetical protein D3C84_1221960 [compost metagenome]
MADRCNFMIKNSFDFFRVVVFGLACDGFIVNFSVDKRIGQSPVHIGTLLVSH